MTKNEDLYTVVISYVVASSTALLPFFVPTMMMGVQPYNLTYLLLSLSVPLGLFGAMAALSWETLEQRQIRYFAFCGGLGWLIGLYPRGDGEGVGIGALWPALEAILQGMIRSTYYPTTVEMFMLVVSSIAFLFTCWGFSGLFRKHTTRKDPFHLRGATRQGARIQRARWATAKEATQHLNVAEGIVLGEMTTPRTSDVNYFKPEDQATWGNHGKGQLLTISPKTGNGHVLVIQESSGFKTTGLVIPNILNYGGPIVVLDPKENLFHRTAEARRKLGFNPVRICATDGLDPFKLLAPLIKGRPSIYYSLAKTLIPEEAGANENSIHFREKSINLLAALLCYYIENNHDRVLLKTSRFLGQSQKQAIEASKEMMFNAPMEFVREELTALQAESEKSYPGLVAGIRNKIAFARFPDVNGFLQQPEGSVKHETILDPKTDIFIDVPTRVLKDFTPLLRLLTGALLIAAQLTEQPGRPRARRLFLLDEAKGLGSLEQLKTVRDEGRDIGLHLMLFYQSWGQVQEIWKQGAQAWEDSTETRILGAIQSSQHSNEIANMLGKDTIAVKTKVNSSSDAKYQMFSGQLSSGENEQVKEISLMNQSDLGKLPKVAALIMTRDLPPILGSKAVYFTRPEMRDQIKTEDDVSDLVQADRKKVQELSAAISRPSAPEQANGSTKRPSASETAETSDEDLVDERDGNQGTESNEAECEPLMCDTPRCIALRQTSGSTMTIRPETEKHPAQCQGCGGQFIDGKWQHSCKECGVVVQPGQLNGSFVPTRCETCDEEARQSDIDSGNVCGFCTKLRHDCTC